MFIIFSEQKYLVKKPRIATEMQSFNIIIKIYIYHKHKYLFI